MAFLHSFAVGDFLDSLVSLFAAFVLGGLIGTERQYRQRGGGLRTHVLVSVGAATFVDIGIAISMAIPARPRSSLTLSPAQAFWALASS